MKKIFLVNILLLIVSLMATNTYALILEGSFRGTVRTFTNGAEDINLTGYWDNVTQGSEASGSFWFDTDKAPQNTSEFTTSGWYQTYTDEWMGSSFHIDGKTYNVSDLPLMDNYGILSEGVWLHNFEQEIDNSTREMFYLFDNISTGDNRGHRSIGLMVEIASEEKSLLDGLGIIQQFDWYNLGDATSYGQAHISLGAVTTDERRTSDAWIDISEFHLRVKNPVDLPEPDTLLLLLMGALALAIKYNRYSNKR